YNLGVLHDTGQFGLEKNELKALELYLQAAALGSADAQHLCGVMYQRGEIVTRDVAKAVSFYSTAAEQGHVAAMRDLATILRHGLDTVATDEKRALKLYRAAAEKGDPGSLCAIGQMVLHGECGLKQSEELALEFLEEAAERGEPVAQFQVARLMKDKRPE